MAGWTAIAKNTGNFHGTRIRASELIRLTFRIEEYQVCNNLDLRSVCHLFVLHLNKTFSGMSFCQEFVICCVIIINGLDPYSRVKRNEFLF